MSDTVTFRAAKSLLLRDFKLHLSRGAGPILAVGFYLTLMGMIPLSLGPDQALLGRIAPGLAWLCLALASLLSLERLFERDYEDGVFDLLRLGPLSLTAIAFLKALAQWLGLGVILSLMTPLVMIILGAKVDYAFWGLITALLGSFCFSQLGAVGAALSVGSRRGGALIALLVLPFYLPPVIFGAGLMLRLSMGLPVTGALSLLGAYALFSLALGPLASGAALKGAL